MPGAAIFSHHFALSQANVDVDPDAGPDTNTDAHTYTHFIADIHAHSDPD